MRVELLTFQRRDGLDESVEITKIKFAMQNVPLSARFMKTKFNCKFFTFKNISKKDSSVAICFGISEAHNLCIEFQSVSCKFFSLHHIDLK